MKFVRLIHLSLVFLFFKFSALGQCLFSGVIGIPTAAGTLNPTTTYQTVSVASGNYFQVNANCGDTYHFTFCSDGGSTFWDTEITILNAPSGTTSLAYNDDACGTPSNVVWTAPSDMTIYVFVTQYSCDATGWASGATLAYNVTSPDPSFVLSPLGCDGVTATITGTPGGTFSFNPVPGDGATIDPSTGTISTGTIGSTYTVEYTLPICGGISSTQTVTVVPPSSSFTLTEVCDGATATIGGITGGTFSFNPPPGDGATIDPSTGTISNVIVGNTYTVEYNLPICGGISSTQSITIPPIDNSFSFTEICGGALVNVTGLTGGVFGFNPAPAPTDVASINPTTGEITNAVPAETYSVEYSVCGTSNVQTFSVTQNDCWKLDGDAQPISVGGNQCYQLTDAINDQAGCAWHNSFLDFSNDFSLAVDYYFGNSGNGADGTTFTFHPNSSGACGAAGEHLGAGGIPNVLSIEFDTYNNGLPADIACDHIALEIDGDHSSAPPLCGPVCAKSGGGSIDDGNTYQVEVQWDATTQQLSIYFDYQLRLTCTNDFVTNAFGGQSKVHWGVTSATGGLFNQQYFCPGSHNFLPAELTSFESICNGSEEVIDWTTASEQNTDYFQLEYTYDGMLYYPVEYTEAAGNSSDDLHYRVIIDGNDVKQRYYRLKTVDLDGHMETSNLIASKNCGNDAKVIQFISEQENLITILLSGESDFQLCSTSGQVVKSGNSSNEQILIRKGYLSSGAYHLRVIRKDGLVESRKMFLK